MAYRPVYSSDSLSKPGPVFPSNIPKDTNDLCN
ncbi:hypothetical protein immuto35A_124 [Flavobacterium phage vB_FspM_immuto_3-5A]|uniref:Uncharacterized protein n=1 Tax=Flavobacterium phage vB_FspM_immuto_2-6A TaxID=2801477 RepID=A0A7T8IX68_9CAUD|nr:hypothetical protein KNV73_gp146 [Flavobacterium phage vB_FspM_immuto_2-6A]QQO91804.1 hypothetical protein immuto26A_125 [Flavobacterium phage vB_FspM_immuto_2-6A]QQO92042.1 hypothetical protein immuto35A_124 [Flavobacterium phage vB_FspM_immuto_3-5A]QQO92280.1 hypothetical protein immuto136C_124 [Flavobacterium phage vB_FspM_immuto_13-6C]